jgi:hypothetical protein
MSFCTLNTVGGGNILKKTLTNTYTYTEYAFNMSTDLGTLVWNNNVLSITDRSGTSSYLNGIYAITMVNYNNNNNAVAQIPYNVLNDNTNFIMTGVKSVDFNRNSYTTYDRAGTVSTTQIASYSVDAYSTSNGTYTGTITTTYNSSQTIKGEYIQLYFPFMLKLNNITIKNLGNNTAPKQIYILGSNNDVQWDLVDIWSNISKTLPGSRTITSTIGYSIFRFVLTQNHLSNVVGLTYLSLSGIAGI